MKLYSISSVTNKQCLRKPPTYVLHVYQFLRKPPTYTIIRTLCLLGTSEYGCRQKCKWFYLVAPLMQSRIAFGIQMHFVINFAANFFFPFHFFFTSFMKYFKGVAPYFSRSYKILWQTRANTKRTPRSWNILNLLKPTPDLNRISYHWPQCWLFFGLLICNSKIGFVTM